MVGKLNLRIASDGEKLESENCFHWWVGKLNQRIASDGGKFV
jgi:hypothetical protein